MNEIVIHKIRQDLNADRGDRYSLIAMGWINGKSVDMRLGNELFYKAAEENIQKAIDFFNALAESDLAIKVDRYDLSKYVK
jgi:hypothetical protein